MPMLPESAEPATGTEPVPYRGEVKPELIQKKMRLQELAEALQALEHGLSPLSPEALQELLKQGDIDIKSLQAGDLTSTSGLFVTNLEGREGLEPDTAAKQAALQQDLEALQAELQQEYGALASQSQAFLYDEWDFHREAYLAAWCRVFEHRLRGEEFGFIEDVRRRHSTLAHHVRRQFGFIKPQSWRRVRRTSDGDELELDGLIEAVIDRRTGHASDSHLYVRRDRAPEPGRAVQIVGEGGDLARKQLREPDVLAKEHGARLLGDLLRQGRLAGRQFATKHVQGWHHCCDAGFTVFLCVLKNSTIAATTDHVVVDIVDAAAITLELRFKATDAAGRDTLRSKMLTSLPVRFAEAKIPSADTWRRKIKRADQGCGPTR